MTHATPLFLRTFALITVLYSLLLSGCGGASSPSPAKAQPIEVEQPTTIEVFGQTYQPWSHSQFTLYVSDESQIAADSPLMLSLVAELEVLSEAFAVHHQPWLIHLNSEPTAIKTQPQYFYLPISGTASDNERQTQLISQLLLSKRHQLSANAPLLLSDVLISEAFAHLIAQTLFATDNQYGNLSLSADEFDALKSDLSSAQTNLFEQSSRWLLTDSYQLKDTGIAMLQHAITHTINAYPGADLMSISTLPLQSFMPFLTATPPSWPIVSDVRLRTPDISEYDQVPADEMHLLQQAHSRYYLHGLHGKKEVALSFDDGPSGYTSQVLAILAEHQITATFFVLGQNIPNREADIRAIHQQGHLLGNHSYRHTDSSTIASHSVLWQSEIANTNDIIFDLVGYAPRLFRPPYGRIRGDQIDYLAARGMRTINWSIDTRDWHTQGVNQQDIEFAASHYSHPEAVILMHDGGGDRSNTVAALDNIIQHYQNAGYRFITLDTLLGIGKAR